MVARADGLSLPENRLCLRVVDDIHGAGRYRNCHAKSERQRWNDAKRSQKPALRPTDRDALGIRTSGAI